jgi:hypothetical protein
VGVCGPDRSGLPAGTQTGVSAVMAIRWAGRNGGKTGIVVAADLIQRARDGDEQAFRELVGPYQRKLPVHCYRILGRWLMLKTHCGNRSCCPAGSGIGISQCAGGPQLP